MTAYFIGIDGGGTSCRAALAAGDGTVLGRGKSGAANILTDPEGGLRHIIEAAEKACEEAGLETTVFGSCHVVLGLAGANVEKTVATVRKRLPFGNCAVESDALIAVHGALGTQDGAAAILGTGSVFGAKKGHRVRTIGGWGFLVGDQGSGAVLGRRLMQEALLAHDGVRAASPVTGKLLDAFDKDPRKLVAFAHDAAPGDFARYAPIVFEFAHKGDPVAEKLVCEAAAQVDEAISVVLAMSEPRLCLLGGLAAPFEPWLRPEHRACVTTAKGDALDGAVSLAIERFSLKDRAHA
ncbi:BadF/BadG/BcrA/BcrD ATPase family protein [Hoeflea poritis]|uniref:N-acetylglucosamine kinase n=1 Tax=Hoeflea poritis TaxID=2993659 RepID=A0ABT4VIZ0_9HYPH|nr:BadF/BadG/BcrA/BcrD ATPase family protein [Hoeflea poritis]MDA4844569.1 N-acetylglucosamine kinase [Hoeflea poritis]